MEAVNPFQEVLKVQGRIINNDGRKRIEIKRPLSSMFAASDYSMELYLNKDKFKERIEEIARKGVLPVLVWFYK
ncbi:hypothetical protein COV19_02875 [Candidatus Woesearchaeota archaeon CG10_big_fil_rev_8_21_14_0_10_44_13]|nr:MAG: hypothetical protein COV19_02875 [Candidatus Woesearchaeota archaeon CG10_big_fil_rev_8_21_14_0_10_44_13]